jgi:hypothetical protein
MSARRPEWKLGLRLFCRDTASTEVIAQHFKQSALVAAFGGQFD